MQDVTELYIALVDENDPGAGVAETLLAVSQAANPNYNLDRDGRVTQPSGDGRVTESWTLNLTCQGADLADVLAAFDPIEAAVKEYWDHPACALAPCIVEKVPGVADQLRAATIYTLEVVLPRPLPMVVDPSEEVVLKAAVQLVIGRSDRWECIDAVGVSSGTVDCREERFRFTVPGGHDNRIARVSVYDWHVETTEEALGEVWIGGKPDPDGTFVGDWFQFYLGFGGADTTPETDTDTKAGTRLVREYLVSTEMDFAASGQLGEFFNYLVEGTMPGEYVVVARLHAQDSEHYVRVGTCTNTLVAYWDKPWAWQRPVLVDGNVWKAFQVGRCIVPGIGRYLLQPGAFEIAFQCQRISGTGELWFDYFALLPLDAFIHLRGAEIRYWDEPVVGHRVAVAQTTRDGQVFGVALNGDTAEPSESDDVQGVLDVRGTTLETMRMRQPGQWCFTAIANRKDGFHPVALGTAYKVRIEWLRGEGIISNGG